ncbi:MAG: hypothetical protein MAG795_00862 [Candidatus Woesearchaeota archaeon]|nr:hypothetical protein [Candidatus Woesearchaeota archaeon]
MKKFIYQSNKIKIKGGEMLEGLQLIPSAVMGIIIGLVEAMFVHSDEGPMGLTWIPHALHALPFTILFVFMSMNLHFVLGLLNLSITESPLVVLIIRGVITIIGMIKIAGSAAIAKGVRGVGVKLPHTIIVGALIFGAPYAWEYAIGGFVGPFIPF